MEQLPKLLYRYRALGRLRGPGSSDPHIVESAPFIISALYFPSRNQFKDACDCLLPDMSHITDEKLLIRMSFVCDPARQFEIAAERVCHPHLLGRSALWLEQLRVADEDADASRPRRRDV